MIIQILSIYYVFLVDITVLLVSFTGIIFYEFS